MDRVRDPKARNLLQTVKNSLVVRCGVSASPPAAGTIGAMNAKSPQRIQTSTAKGWTLPDGAVYVGPGSQWRNSWTVVAVREHRAARYELVDPDALMVVDVDRQGRNASGIRFAAGWDRIAAKALAVDLFRRGVEATYLDADGPATIELWLRELAGRDLACSCRIGEPCHADYLLRIANGHPVWPST